MAYQRFSLFPDSPSFKDFFSARSMRYRWRNGDPVITVTIMAICVAVWIVETLLKIVWPTGCNAFVGSGAFMPALATHRPWTFITSMFLHQPASLWHILFNMLTLWCVGPVLERMMGHLPYLALYVLSGLGGSAGMMVWSLFSQDGWLTSAYGASGALFGLFAAILVVYQRIGIDIRSMLIWMLINFLMPIHHAEHRMAGACRRIHHRRSVHLAAGFRSARVARQKSAAAHADVRRNHVGRDYCDCRRMQYEQSTSRKPPSWHVLLVGRQEKKQIWGIADTHLSTNVDKCVDK